MFVDVCFPKNNEKEFIEIAEKLGTEGLVFLYDAKTKIPEIKEKKIKIWQFYLNNNPGYNKKKIVFRNNFDKITKKKQIIYFYDGFKKIKKNFHAPTKNITQVKIKSLKEQENIFGISFIHVLKCSPEEMEIVKFVVKLCSKYKLKMFFASFAEKPELLRAKSDLISVMKEINIKNQKNNRVLNNLFFHLK
jgi:RNase P/RNase MRP subunit p30